MNRFLRAVVERREAEHVERVLRTPYEALPAVRVPHEREGLARETETPKAQQLRQRREQVERVALLRRLGLETHEIVERTGLTERQVRRAAQQGARRGR